jgi:hypothetical protein
MLSTGVQATLCLSALHNLNPKPSTLSALHNLNLNPLPLSTAQPKP